MKTDTTVARVDRDGTYLIDVWGSPELKRIQRLVDGGISVWSDVLPHCKEARDHLTRRILGGVVCVWNEE